MPPPFLGIASLQSVQLRSFQSSMKNWVLSMVDASHFTPYHFINQDLSIFYFPFSAMGIDFMAFTPPLVPISIETNKDYAFMSPSWTRVQ